MQSIDTVKHRKKSWVIESVGSPNVWSRQGEKFHFLFQTRTPFTMSTPSMPSITTAHTQLEPLLDESKRRLCLFPLEHADMWEWYKRLMSTFWLPEDITLDQDVIDYNEKLTDDERYYLDNILGFFSSADCIVNLNLLSTFSVEITSVEAACFLTAQAAQENVHAEVYSLFIDRLVRDEKRKDELFNALEKCPAIAQKAKWALKWSTPELSLATRLVAWSVIEGLLFAASFAAIAFFKTRGLLPGLATANEYISRDESLHCSFAAECLYKDHIVNKLPKEQVWAIVSEAVDIEDVFVTESLPVRLIGMSADDMKKYVRFCANRLMGSLGVPPLYSDQEATCPWDWVQLISTGGSTNFFEKKVADYAKSSLQKHPLDFDTEVEEDF